VPKDHTAFGAQSRVVVMLRFETINGSINVFSVSKYKQGDRQIKVHKKRYKRGSWKRLINFI